MAEREENIDIISKTYPIDSEYHETAETGRALLYDTVIEIYGSWRNLPDDVLELLATKCINAVEEND